MLRRLSKRIYTAEATAPRWRIQLPAGQLLFTHGRGIHLMTVLMDEVRFEERGGLVMMRKKSNTGSAEAERRRRQ